MAYNSSSVGGADLVRVSPEDGHLTDSDAYDFPDENAPWL
jgi:hypothetical protein